MTAGKAKYVYGIHDGFAMQHISYDKPVELFLGQVLGSPYGNHAVCAYGYTNSISSIYYVANVGWNRSVDPTYGNRIINSSWSIGAVYIDF